MKTVRIETLCWVSIRKGESVDNRSCCQMINFRLSFAQKVINLSVPKPSDIWKRLMCCRKLLSREFAAKNVILQQRKPRILSSQTRRNSFQSSSMKKEDRWIRSSQRLKGWQKKRNGARKNEEVYWTPFHECILLMFKSSSSALSKSFPEDRGSEQRILTRSP